jgi:diphthamide biosynthesis methyltransferase
MMLHRAADLEPPAAMRTTVNLSESALEVARRHADARSMSLGQAVSDLIERAQRQQLAAREVNGVWVADLPLDERTVTSQDVEDLLDNE